jgi:acrylyl-CoA reductase (NADPH)
MNQTFSVLRARQHDGRTSVSMEQSVIAELSPGEVVIRACYSDVNYKDALAATGRNSIIRSYPRIPGIDVAGIVQISDDEHFQPGDKVVVTGHEFGTGHDGGYAEYVRVPAEWVVALPEGLSLYESMALGTAGFTAAMCVERMERNHQRPEMGPIAVTGATGGVGSIAVDILSRRGYSVSAITGKEQDADYLRRLGAAEVIDRRALAMSSQPLERGMWGGAIDNVGGEMLAWLTRTTRPWGNICSVGLAGGAKLETTVMPFILRGVALLGVTASNCPKAWRNRIWQRLGSDLKPTRLSQIVRREVGLSELPAVFEAVLAGTLTGRTIVRIAEE